MKTISGVMNFLFSVIVITIIFNSLQHVGGFQQIAGPVLVNVSPGETKSFSWGLVAGNNETSNLRIYADGNGSEFLSIPASFKLVPGIINNITGNVTIPANYPTNTTLNPIVHSTISENDTSSRGNAVNVELSKLLTLTIGGNNTEPSNGTKPNTITPNPIQLGMLTRGSINSLITTPATKWIASGNWSLDVKDGNITLFETKMIWNNVNGTDSHTHEFLNLRIDKPFLLNTSDKNVSIKGLIDVATNGRVIWKDVPSTIDINGKKTISISVSDNKTNHHFASQPIFGVVGSFLFCSDIPGPNMQVLPTCSEPTAMGSSPTLSTENFNRNQSNNALQTASVLNNYNESESEVQPSISNPVSSDNFGFDSSTPGLNNPSDVNFLTYVNNALEFKLNYPSSWKLNESAISNPLLDVITQWSNPYDDSSFTVGIRRAEALENTIGDFANSTIRKYENYIKGYQTTVYNSDRALSGNPSYQIEGTYLDDKSVERHLIETGILYKNKVYVFLFNSSQIAYLDLLPAVSKAVQSIQFVPTDPNLYPPHSNDFLSDRSAQSCEVVYSSNATANGFETDPKDYNPPGDAIDGDLKTWWANKEVPSWLQVDLQKTTTLCSVEVAWNKGEDRTYDFEIATSTDGSIFTPVFKGKSSGNTENYEKYDLDNFSPDVKSLKLSITDSSSKKGWVSIKEVKLIGKGY
jgi:hypothetical protein